MIAVASSSTWRDDFGTKPVIFILMRFYINLLEYEHAYLNPVLVEPGPGRRHLPGQNVRVVRVLEQALQLIQLVAREARSVNINEMYNYSYNVKV